MAHFNFRLFLRPTAIGKMIIDRLTSEGVDRQAEARRWIELGYMCEQAGFRVEGTTLFQAGRPANAEVPAPIPVPVYGMPFAATSPVVESSSAPRKATPISAITPVVHQPASPPGQVEGTPQRAIVSQAPVNDSSSQVIDSELTSSLRNLAH